MIYSTKELLQMGETQYSIREKVKNRSLYMISRGMYSDNQNELVETEACIFKRYPNAIFTGIYAFSFYDLTDQVPQKYDVVTPQHSFPIRKDDVNQSYQDISTINIGVSIVETKNGLIRIYDLERMLIELIRLKRRYSPEIYYEVINSYRKIKDKLDYIKLNKYAKGFKNGDRLLFKIKELI